MFLRIESLFFRYGSGEASWVIEDYSLAMTRGEIVGLAGPSGRGKSTLLRLVAGLERPERGSITIDGVLMAGPGVWVAPEQRHVGMVFQDYGIFPHLTVAGNIGYGLHRLARAARRARTAQMLELIRMEELAARYPTELSGGQQQRTALARALAPEPKLLLLDEPFSSLDAELKADIRLEVRNILHAAKATCLLVSHDQADLERVCDRILFLG